MGDRPLIACLSDVSVGYGSPQGLDLSRALAGRCGGTALVLETDQNERPPLPVKHPAVLVERLSTTVNPHAERGRIEFCLQARARLETLRPEILILCNAYALPVLLSLTHRPQVIILLALERMLTYGDEDLQLIRLVRKRLDLLIFPEENRALLESRRCLLHGLPTVVMYNVKMETVPPQPVSARNGRFIYGGTIHPALTFADYYLSEDVGRFPIDLYGLIDGPGHDALRCRLEAGNGGVRYRGSVPGGGHFSGLLSHYCFSLVTWTPDREDTYYAAPNKFFESIACGVPPIAAPHPICATLINRYGCGLLLRDWSLAAFRDGLAEAAVSIGTPRFQTLVDRCRRAFEQELNWDAQFAKVVRQLDRIAPLLLKGNPDGE
ncbi:MAG: hypothetical protein GC191_17090 [Azospirillum sp.]|nr:hypothetical protein [Azospirillum sp.]